jgi:hypothetical protein
MNGLPTGRVISRMLVMGALLPCAGAAFAADPVGAVAPAHGPMLMIYVSQPLLSGASRVYGLRLNQVAPTAQIASAATAASGFYAASPQRSLVDLQIRRLADVRVAFGNRLTWNVRRQEFEFPNARPVKPIDFVAAAHQARP